MSSRQSTFWIFDSSVLISETLNCCFFCYCLQILTSGARAFIQANS
jgi:hypothetical protein